MSSFWASFLPSVCAAISGASVGIVGVLIGFRLNRRAAYRDGIDAAVGDLLSRISDVVSAVPQITEAEEQRSVAPFRDEVEGVFAIQSSAFVLQVKSRRSDFDIASQISSTVTSLRYSLSLASQLMAFQDLAAAIMLWRTGQLGSTEAVVKMIESVEDTNRVRPLAPWVEGAEEELTEGPDVS